VPEVPTDPAYYIRALDQHRYFESSSISAEDLQRTQFYKADNARQALETSANDLDAFLQSLNMVARVDRVLDATVERTAQLINRSNQFNLTTRRYTNADVIRMKGDSGWITRTVSLRDRFGDNGLISVVLATIDSDALVIDTWLMSCRVLKRGVEALVLNTLVRSARDHGLHRIVGEYIPTAKNGLVRDHYRKLGFSEVSSDTSGHTRWELKVDDAWRAKAHFIQESQVDEPNKT
jgi:FkbH-like protein